MYVVSKNLYATCKFTWILPSDAKTSDFKANPLFLYHKNV